MMTTPAKTNSVSDQLLAELFDQLAEAQIKGGAEAVDAFLAGHPQQADELRRLLPALDALDGWEEMDSAGNQQARGDARSWSGKQGPRDSGILTNSATAPDEGILTNSATSPGGDRILTNSATFPDKGILTNSATADAGHPAQIGDFRIVREIGRGGMGVVYEAEQVSLKRRVALKVLPFASLLDTRQLRRFQNEARAAAGLHHANIVPVYSVGSERGLPFFAMQYIEGQTLAQAIALIRHTSVSSGEAGQSEYGTGESRKHVNGESEAGATRRADPPANLRSPLALGEARASQSTAATPLTSVWSTNREEYFRVAARLAIQAAEALDAAHQQGVIHRDVKPSNLLLDETGKLWIADFGLARISADPNLTNTGDVMGTLRYMSPEQVLADRPLTDHRTDVYSLGATLYELVTLQPAFPGDDRALLARQVERDEPRPPHRVNPAVPAELEAIVLKAMEKEVPRRYATAQELADDLRRWIDNLPIRARQATLAGRLLKLSRRYRAFVRLAAAFLALAFVGMTAAYFQLRDQQKLTEIERNAARDAEARERQQASAARLAADDAREQARLATERQVEAEAARQTADERRRESQAVLESARVVVDDMLTRLGTELFEQPQMEQVREEMREKALDFYERYVRDDAGDPQARLEKGRVFRRLGWVQLFKQKLEPSLENYRRADAIAAKLFQEFPDDPQMWEEHSASQEELAVILNAIGRPAEAFPHFRRAYELSAALISRHPDRRTALARFATQARYLSDFERRRFPGHEPDVETGLAICEAARRTYDQLIADYPDDYACYSGGPGIYANLADALADAGRPLEEAEAAYRHGCDLARDAIVRFGPRQEIRNHLANLLLFTARFLDAKCGKFDDAERMYREAIQIRTELAARHPVRHMQWVADFNKNFARFLRRRGKSADAEIVFRDAISAYQATLPLVDAAAQIRFRNQLGFTQFELAQLLESQSRADDVVAAWQAAATTYVRLLDDQPDSPLNRHNAAACCSLMATILSAVDRPAEAETAWRQALTIREAATAVAEPGPGGKIDFAALGSLQALVESGEVPDQRWCYLADSLALARLLVDLRRAEDARSISRRALQIAKKLAESHPQASEPQQLLESLRNALE